jgi:glycerate-2-kinase
MSLVRLREAACRIQAAALAAADPRAAVSRALSTGPEGIAVLGAMHEIRGALTAIAVGKAAAGMMEAALDRAGSLIDGGLVVVPHTYPTDRVANRRISVMHAGHPVPDEGSREAAREVLRRVEAMVERDLCLLLLSGGGSSLLSLPWPGLNLDDLVQTGRLLLASGADIAEMNTVRRHLSVIAGGRLAERCRGTILTLAISDVVGDDLHVIASGPTVPDPTTYADAAAVLERRGLTDRIPAAVCRLIRDGAAGRIPDTPKHVPGRHETLVISSGLAAVEGAAAAARALGFAPQVLDTRLSGEARLAGRALARAALAARRGPGPACLIAAGETTVTVTGTGRGGRNQEIALSAAIEIEGVPGILLASFATDGREGNSDAAGAFATGETVAAGRMAGLDPAACLEANDSNAFLAAARELIVTGPTGTNVNDVSFALVETER